MIQSGTEKRRDRVTEQGNTTEEIYINHINNDAAHLNPPTHARRFSLRRGCYVGVGVCVRGAYNIYLARIRWNICPLMVSLTEQGKIFYLQFKRDYQMVIIIITLGNNNINYLYLIYVLNILL